MKQIAIFASGTGTNARQIMQYFEEHPSINVSLIISDHADAGVKKFAREFNVDFIHLPYRKLCEQDHTMEILRSYQTDLIVLAGFMRLIPEYLIREFPDRILNIHPALLPKYGGKGMYGHHVHEKVKENKEKETGISIHLVDEKYDHGKTIFQKAIDINASDSADEIAEKVRTLEHKYYPKVIHSWIRDHLSS